MEIKRKGFEINTKSISKDFLTAIKERKVSRTKKIENILEGDVLFVLPKKISEDGIYHFIEVFVEKLDRRKRKVTQGEFCHGSYDPKIERLKYEIVDYEKRILQSKFNSKNGTSLTLSLDKSRIYRMLSTNNQN